MRRSKTIGYVVGCVGLLTVGSALAKDPEQTAERGLSTPAGCTDSVRGRTHILRFCGNEHYWIKRPMAGSPWSSPQNAANAGFGGGGAASYSDAVSSAGLNGAGR